MLQRAIARRIGGTSRSSASTSVMRPGCQQQGAGYHQEQAVEHLGDGRPALADGLQRPAQHRKALLRNNQDAGKRRDNDERHGRPHADPLPDLDEHGQLQHGHHNQEQADNEAYHSAILPCLAP